MARSVEKSAKTVEEAIELALNELGLDQEDVDVEIIDKLKGPGFKFDGMVPDEVRLGDSDRFVG